MKILLDAYLDNNFGDDLFIELLLKKYPNAFFYIFSKQLPDSVAQNIAGKKNITILPEDCFLQENWFFDAFVMIGGDVLPDGVDYTTRINRMKWVKAQGGFVAMLGFSLYKNYSEKTINDLAVMAELADSIVIRDSVSAQRYKQLVPEAKVVSGTDMAFTSEIAKKITTQDKRLGMIPRRKLYSTDEEHEAYCQGQAAIADMYVEKYLDAKVRFLAFSTGEYDDRETAKDIVSMMKYKDSAEIIAYTGDIKQFVKSIAECSELVATRFHGLVFALLLQIPFIPVIYEAKLEQLLEQLNYTGLSLPYGEKLTQEQVEQSLRNIESFGIREEELDAYVKKAGLFFADMDAWAKNQSVSEREVQTYQSGSCPIQLELKTAKERQVATEQHLAVTEQHLAATEQRLVGAEQQLEIAQQQLEEFKAQLAAAKAQEEELEKWIQSLKGENQAKEEELMKWIQSLQQERQAFEKQNLELESIRQWQWEQMMKNPLQRGKITKEYNSFIQSLKEKMND